MYMYAFRNKGKHFENTWDFFPKYLIKVIKFGKNI